MLVAGVVGIVAMGCGGSNGRGTGTGGVFGPGNPNATGGAASGGAPSADARTGAGGSAGSGGQTNGHRDSGDAASTGGTIASGGNAGTLGRTDARDTGASGGSVGRDAALDAPGVAGGASSGGMTGVGGASGGVSGTSVGGGGTLGTGGVATGGASGTGTLTIDCNAVMPSNGVEHSGNTQGTLGTLAWNLWSNGTGATMTVFDVPAFRVTWGPKSGDVLARLGLDFGESGLTYDQYGPITAQFTETKSGTGGSYSYIGVFGFTVDPCVEFYIVDDSYSAMPFVPWAMASKGTVTIDGDAYDLYSGTVVSTGSSSCRGSTWYQFFGVRQSARTCGQIPLTQHFDAWKAAGMKLGNLTRIEILAEVGGGTGSIDFPIANVIIGP